VTENRTRQQPNPRHLERFFSWDACDGNGRGVGGVTGERRQAAELLMGALAGLSFGAVGSVRLVRLDQFAWPPSYVHCLELLKVRRDEDGRIVVGGE
jgi:hypothetical protein